MVFSISENLFAKKLKLISMWLIMLQHTLQCTQFPGGLFSLWMKVLVAMLGKRVNKRKRPQAQEIDRKNYPSFIAFFIWYEYQIHY